MKINKILSIHVLTFLMCMTLLFIVSVVANDLIIEKGDELYITVEEQDEFAGVYEVNNVGNIFFPILNKPLKAQGFSYDQFAESLKIELEKDYFYKATVKITTYNSKSIIPLPKKTQISKTGGVIYTYGMIGQPGAVTIPDNEIFTVSKVVMRSGGFKDFANRKKVKLYRYSSLTKKTETIIVNLVNVIEKGKLEEDVVVKDGDLIVVPEKFFNF